jgi:hypothetical protein
MKFTYNKINQDWSTINWSTINSSTIKRVTELENILASNVSKKEKEIAERELLIIRGATPSVSFDVKQSQPIVAVEMNKAIQAFRNVDTRLALANSVANFEQANEGEPVVNMNPNNEGEPFILVTQDPLEAVEPEKRIEVVLDNNGNVTVRPTPPTANPEADKEKIKKYITFGAIGLVVVVFIIIGYKSMK